MLNLRLSSGARRELLEAVDWYNAKRPTLGSDFFMALQRLIETIEDFPEFYPLTHKYFRWANMMPPFPYKIIFRTTETEIYIIAIAHHKRADAYWHERAEL